MKNKGKIAFASILVLFLLVVVSIMPSKREASSINNESNISENTQKPSEFPTDDTKGEVKIPINILYETNTYFISENKGDFSFNDKESGEVLTYAYKSENTENVFDVSSKTEVELNFKITLNWKDLEKVIEKINTSLLEVKDNEAIIGVGNSFELTDVEIHEKIGMILNIQPYIIDQYLNYGKKVYTYWE